MRFRSDYSMKTKTFAALCGILLLVFTAYLSLGESERPRILRPPDKSVLPPGPVEIAVIVPGGSEPPSVTLDGERLKLSSPSSNVAGNVSRSRRLAEGVFFPPAVVIVRSLSPGLHKLRAGDTTVQFFVRDEDGKKIPPKKWSHYTPHPPAVAGELACTACHELSKEQRFTNMNAAFSMEKPTGCFDCHERLEFNLTHNHRYESLAFCQMCHDAHGATDDRLLKMPAQKACTLCHE